MSDVVSIVFIILMIGTFVLGVVVGECLAYDKMHERENR